MGYAVELFYDEEAEQAVRKVWDGIGVKLGKPSLSDLGARLHRRPRYDRFPGAIARIRAVHQPFRFLLKQCKRLHPPGWGGVPCTRGYPAIGGRAGALPRGVFTKQGFSRGTLPARELDTALYGRHRSGACRNPGGCWILSRSIPAGQGTVPGDRPGRIPTRKGTVYLRARLVLV